MIRRSICGRAAIIAALMIASGTTSAFYQDPTTGFALTPPKGWTVEQSSGRRQFDVGVTVNPDAGRPRKAGNGPGVCEAGFKAAANNAGLTQKEINDLVNKPEWVKLARTTIELVFQISGQQRFTLQGFRGIEFQGRPKAGPNAENARIFMSIVETPKGRVSMVCAIDKADFAGALPKLRAIRAGINLPQ
jgi:hypothetical protein